MLLNTGRKLALGFVLALATGSVLTGCQTKAGEPSTQSPAGTQGSVTEVSASPAGTPGKNGAVDAIAFDAQEAVILIGQPRKLAVFGLNAKKEKTGLTDAKNVTYSSSKPEVATVDANGTVTAGDKAAIGSSSVITAQYKGKSASVTVKVKYALEETVKSVSGKNIVTNETDMAVVINKKRGLPDKYEPADLTEPKVDFSFSGKSEKKLLRKEAAEALEKLFKLASQDSIKLYGVSGYRSKATQTTIYNYNIKTQGQEETDKVSAKPGFSEHQTGLAIDVSSQSAKFALEETFGATKEGKWLAANAHKAGFIIRYPKGKESITGYSYEPWHIRYVGLDIANDIHESGQTLEEYFQDALPVNG